MGTSLRYDDYTVAWIAVLQIEAEAALGMLDKRHKGQFESTKGDDYLYFAGEVNGHNVVVATLPSGQNYGIGAAAALVNQVKTRFPNIWFALLVGVAAGLPNHSSSDRSKNHDIRLGDVLVCLPDGGSTGIVHYDLGRETEDGFLVVGRQAETPAIVRSAIGSIRLNMKNPYKPGNEIAAYLASFQKAMQEEDNDSSFERPDEHTDQLFALTTKMHELPAVVPRVPREGANRYPRVWYGSIGSGNSLRRNAQKRDELRDKHNLIGLEMEAAGVMNSLPTGVIRGVCDYSDNQKNKVWQPYAAAAAAAYAKGVLYAIRPVYRPTPRGQSNMVPLH